MSQAIYEAAFTTQHSQYSSSKTEVDDWFS